MTGGLNALGEPSFHPDFDVPFRFLGSVYVSESVDELCAGWLATVSWLIRADAYGIYFLDAGTRKPRRVATKGAGEGFLEQYEDVGRACDPVLEYVLRTREPVHNKLLFSDREWKSHPLRQVLAGHDLARTMQAPLVVGGEVVGTLDFARNAGAPSFTDGDICCVRVIAHHTAKALARILAGNEQRQRCALAEAALETVGLPIVVSDEEGRIVYANYLAEELAGMAADRSRGESFKEALRGQMAGLESHRMVTNNASLDRPGLDGGTSTSIILRSTWLADRSGVLTSLHSGNSGQDYDHLAHVLSPREREVLELVAQGLRNKQIAETLQVSINTVKHHMRRMFEKMQADSRSQLLARTAHP